MDYCAICGADISTDDYYSSIRKKYCKKCAADAKRSQNAERMRKVRQLSRQQHSLRRQLCEELERENELLRAELIRQRERVRSLEEKP